MGKNQQKLYVEKTGSGKQNVVLLHGLLSSHAYWDNVVDQLDPKAYTIYRFDLLGFGESPKPENATYYVDEQVEAIVRSLGDEKQFILVGHSMGALIAVRYAATYPDSVQKLILCNTPLFTEGNDILEIVASSNLAPKFMVKGKVAELVCRSAHHIPLIKKALSYYPHKLPKNIRADFLKHTWNSYSKSLANLLETYDPIHDLKTLKMPVVALIGTKDKITSSFVVRAKLPPNVAVTSITDADHHIPVFHQNEVASEINKGQ